MAIIGCRKFSFLAVVAGLVACGCDAKKPAPATYKYDYSTPGSVDVFHDDATANRQVAAGELPSNFESHSGQPVDLAAYRGNKNLVVVVTRGIPQSPGGVPCPYCVAQTNSLVGNYQQFQDRDTEVVVIFPGPTQLIDDFILQSAKTPDLPFPLVLDRDLKACAALGIRGDLAKPSTYILDKAGHVVYAYVGESLTDRPSLKAVFRVLDRLSPPISTRTPVSSRTPASTRTAGSSGPGRDIRPGK